MKVLYTRLTDFPDPAYWDRLLHALPQQIGEKIRRYPPGQQQWQRIAGKYLLQELLQELLPAAGYTLDHLTTAATNKPFIPDAAFHFSISHSCPFVVCAAARDIPCGIDTELLQPLRLDLMEAYFAPGTWVAITAAADPLQACYKEWVRREAALKASGKGLQEITPADLQSDERSVTIGRTRYETRMLSLEAAQLSCIAAERLPDIIPVAYSTLDL